MKRILPDLLKNWFGYTRRERRSSFFLLLVTLAIAGIRFIVPAHNLTIQVTDISSFGPLFDSAGKTSQNSGIQSHYNKNYSVQRERLLELNSCDSASLESLPGLGPVLSSRIIKYRNLLGGFVSVEQLREVYGLSEETYKLVSVMLKADSGLVRKIPVNSADYRQLIRLPYFERSEVSSILKYRELMKKVESIGELVENKIITPEKAKKISPYLSF
ncbi:MAG TPA: helix-hairpin-helix domain-containing protein [Bacteroidales bacterium]|jgi:DNA uptake protein ComE-like DNA-binding protein|nr:helix-hairpin-helix domain-containing protein [Bacteroidales bacterium]HQG63719.1 helix-hairpin-helix domain-containing protein [Bacteroidales bacterium]HQK68821.1 helix-hairpin-helix domain-containing protein [Bacteroidales bacterium]